MVCPSLPYHFKMFKGCLPQTLLGPVISFSDCRSVHRKAHLFKNTSLKMIEASFRIMIMPYLPIKCRWCPHIETNQLICTAKYMTGFYMRATLAFDGLNCVSAKMAKATFYPYRKSFTRFFFTIHLK